MRSIRLFIACIDDRLRLALLMFLEDRPGMAVVGISDRLKGLLSQLEGSEPDVLLLDRGFPVQPLADLLSDLHQLECRPKTIVFLTRPEEAEAITASGADYLIAKDAPPDDLLPILDDIRLSASHHNASHHNLKEK